MMPLRLVKLLIVVVVVWGAGWNSFQSAELNADETLRDHQNTVLRSTRMTELKLHIDYINRICNLDEEQITKLETTAADLVNTFVDYSAKKQAAAKNVAFTTTDANSKPFLGDNLFRTVMPLSQHRHWKLTIERTLDLKQTHSLAVADQEREIRMLRTILQSSADRVSKILFLDVEQSTKLSKLCQQEMIDRIQGKVTKMGRDYTNEKSIYLYITEKHVGAFLTKTQLKKWKSLASSAFA